MLNILPLDKKQRIEQESIHRLIRASAIVVSVTFIIIDVIFIASRYGINWWSQQLQETPNNIALSEENKTQIIAQLDMLDATLNAIQDLGPEPHPLPVAILPLKNLPEGISISSINTNFTNGEVSIRGIAVNRDALLTLQESYHSYLEYKTMNFPVSNLTIRENIPFTAETILPTPASETSSETSSATSSNPTE